MQDKLDEFVSQKENNQYHSPQIKRRANQPEIMDSGSKRTKSNIDQPRISGSTPKQFCPVEKITSCENHKTFPKSSISTTRYTPINQVLSKSSKDSIDESQSTSEDNLHLSQSSNSDVSRSNSPFQKSGSSAGNTYKGSQRAKQTSGEPENFE